MYIFLQLFKETFLQACGELWYNKLRTFLSLLGVSIGIFCVISVAAMIDSLELNIRQSVDKLGSDVLYVEKWSWVEEGEYKWWEFVKRPNVNYGEMQVLQNELEGASSVSMNAQNEGCLIKFEDKNIEEASQVFITDDFDKTWEFELLQGRFISKSEFQTGAAVVVVGYGYFEKLFDLEANAIGKIITINGTKLEVIGVLAKEGKGLIDISFDNSVVSPMRYGLRVVNLKNSNEINQQIAIKAANADMLQELKAEVRGKMRAIRRLKPKDKDNFSINELSIVSKQLSKIFSTINLAGIIIGLLSILVGGFGIANIMFVSVKERTNLIGIKKAIGARKSYIIAEFLIESVLLCIAGGIVGILLVLGLASLITYVLDFSIFLSIKNIMKGIAISTAIGLASGILPAIYAANLDPVEAIRSK